MTHYNQANFFIPLKEEDLKVLKLVEESDSLKYGF